MASAGFHTRHPQTLVRSYHIIEASAPQLKVRGVILWSQEGPKWTWILEHELIKSHDVHAHDECKRLITTVELQHWHKKAFAFKVDGHLSLKSVYNCVSDDCLPRHVTHVWMRFLSCVRRCKGLCTTIIKQLWKRNEHESRLATHNQLCQLYAVSALKQSHCTVHYINSCCRLG